MELFFQPEGYVQPDGNGGFEYVYQYKDIWRNVRLSYSDSNNDGDIDSATEILDEKNYYPFGLQHKGYNKNVIGAENNYKTYQGQELTEELDLNIHEWKYRISDPAIGRFWQVDPLAEKFYYNSPYAFQENKLGSGIELEGLENVTWQKLSTWFSSKVQQTKKFIFNQIKYDMQTIDSEGNYHSATFRSARRAGLQENKVFADTREMVQSFTENSDFSIQGGKRIKIPGTNLEVVGNLDIGEKEQTAKVSTPLAGVEVVSKTEEGWQLGVNAHVVGKKTTLIGPKLEAEYTLSATIPVPELPGVSIGGKINAEEMATDVQSTEQNIINANNGNGIILDPYFNPFER